MRHLKCSSCGSEFPAGAMFSVDDAAVCESCGDRLLKEARAKRQAPRVARLIDSTICARCKTDFGDTELPLVGGNPICATCAPALYARPFPVWLKVSGAALVAVLAFALWREGPYFRAGRELVRARRAMDRRDYPGAATHFAAVLPVHPTEQDVVLEGARAYLLAGDPAGAHRFLELRQKFKKDALFTTVDSLWDRATDAYKKALDAESLAKVHREAEAARLMHEAAQEYPQSVSLRVGALTYAGAEAFDRKDYNTYVQLSRQAVALLPGQPRVLGTLAGALACQYAVTGDTTFSAEAEALLRQAQGLLSQVPAEKAAFEEYAERIRYRLRTREIIDKDEYDHRFRRKRAGS